MLLTYTPVIFTAIGVRALEIRILLCLILIKLSVATRLQVLQHTFILVNHLGESLISTSQVTVATRYSDKNKSKHLLIKLTELLIITVSNDCCVAGIWKS